MAYIRRPDNRAWTAIRIRSSKANAGNGSVDPADEAGDPKDVPKVLPGRMLSPLRLPRAAPVRFWRCKVLVQLVVIHGVEKAYAPIPYWMVLQRLVPSLADHHDGPLERVAVPHEAVHPPMSPVRLSLPCLWSVAYQCSVFQVECADESDDFVRQT